MSGHNTCINMRLSQTDLKLVKEEKKRTNATTSTVISSAIERGFALITIKHKEKEKANERI